MRLLDRRKLLLGAAGVGACSTPSADQCDPARGGFVRGLRCSNQYETRQGVLADRVRHAEARVLAARQERAQLIRDRDRLQATLDDINYRISAIDQRRASLERGLTGLNDRAAVLRYIGDLQEALRAYDEGATEIIDFSPPAYLHEEGLRRLEQQKQSMIASRAEARQIRGRLALMAAEFAAGQIAQEVVVRFLRWALTRLGLAFLNPLVSAAATVADIIGLIQFAIDAYNTAPG